MQHGDVIKHINTIFLGWQDSYTVLTGPSLDVESTNVGEQSMYFGHSTDEFQCQR